MFIFLQNVLGHALYTIKVTDNDVAKYISSDLKDDKVVLSSHKSVAKGFWIQQNTIDPNFVKIHCDDNGNQVLTVTGKDGNSFTYKDASDKDLESQQFLIYRSPKYVEQKNFVYLILYKDMYMTWENDELLLKKVKNDEYLNQEFTFESLDSDNRQAPTKFLWDEIKYDEDGIPEIILGPTKLIFDTLNDTIAKARMLNESDTSKSKEDKAVNKNDENKNENNNLGGVTKETISMGISISDDAGEKK